MILCVLGGSVVHPVEISVIIPTFNRADLVVRAVRSVLDQTHSPREIIVVDDGSTDDTASMVQEEFPGITHLYQSNSGVSSARNSGIKKAAGTWIAFLDSDDEWLPDKLSRQWEALKNNPEMKICHTDEIWIRNGRRVNPRKKHLKSGGWIFQKCLPLCCISPSSVVIHQSVFDWVGLFDETLPVCEDYDFWLRVTSQFPVLYVDEPLTVKYGGHEDQLSEKFWGMDRFRIRALQKILTAGILSREDRNAAQATLAEKLHIFIQGARKRGRWEEAEAYEKKFATTRSKLNFVVALSAEARPIIRHFGLKPLKGDFPFKVYHTPKKDLWLVISGVGTDLASAATSFLATVSEANEKTAWLNVGIGGHRDLPLGTAVLASRITGAAQELQWNPPILFNPPGETGPVKTVEQSVEDYPTNDVYDMEAAGFYLKAVKLSQPERVHVLKIVSDNLHVKLETVSRSSVIQMVEDSLGTIEQTANSIRRLPSQEKA